MGKAEELASDQSVTITSLCKTSKATMEVANTIQLSLCSVQQWTNRFCGAREADQPLQKSTGGPKKTTAHTLKVLRRQENAVPHITTPQLKEKNPVLLGGVSVRTVCHQSNRNYFPS